jgi:GNAT superfamily N-acetyltransferase
MPALIVRGAIPSDVAVLSALAQRSKAHWGYPPEWLEAWRPALTLSADYLARHTVLVAESAGSAVGFAAVRDAGAHWELEHLWVEPGSHGRGVGRTLFAMITETARRMKPMRVRIESDPHAVEFYERCGAYRVGTVPAPVLGNRRELPVLEFELTATAQAGPIASPGMARPEPDPHL